jgi:two-component system, OmpR family, sensor kinase
VNLRVRLLSAALAFVVATSLLGLLLIHSVATSETRQIDQQLVSFLPMTKTVNTSTLPVQPAGRTTPRPFNTSHFSALYLAIVSEGRRRVLSTPLATRHLSPQLPTPISTSLDNVKIMTVASRSGSLSWRAVLVALPHNREILVAAPLNQVDATMRFLRFALLLAGFAVLAVLIATGYWISRLGLRPIAEVTDVAEAIVEGDRTRRVATLRPTTEAGKLARAFNVMLDEQQALEARLRQFVADASHELRTPLSVILGITGLWRRGELRVGDQRDEAIHRIGASANQMGSLVEDLLLLARLDEGRPMDRAPVDLSAVVRDVIADVLSTTPTRTIALSAPPSVVVLGDEASLRQIGVNLISNAVRHTPQEADVAVRILENEDSVRLEVEDSGPGMTPDEVSRAFDRFWQADSSRSSNGSGLGLAIVRSMADAFGGKVSLVSDTAKGTRIIVIIPRIT